MINFLKDTSVDTFIGELPGILNWNNRSIEKEFEFLYDSSNNYLRQSLYAPSGSVRSHWGRFVNLYCDYISIGNTESFRNLISQIPHNYFTGRFSNEVTNSDGTIDYCHDLSAIASGLNDGESLAGRLGRLETKINELYYYLTLKNGTLVNNEETKESYTGYPDYIDPSVWVNKEINAEIVADSSYKSTIAKYLNDNSTNEENTLSNNIVYSTSKKVIKSTNNILKSSSNTISKDYINALNNKEIKSYKYERNIFTVPITTVKNIVKNKSELQDIKNKKLYTYYIVDSNAIKINNKRENVLYANTIGLIIDIIFDNTDNKDFYIKLTKKSSLKIVNKELICLKLISTNVEQDGFTDWKVYSFSVLDNSDIEIIKK